MSDKKTTWMDIRISKFQLEVLIKAAKQYLEDYKYKGSYDEDGLYHSSMDQSEKTALAFFIDAHTCDHCD